MPVTGGWGYFIGKPLFSGSQESRFLSSDAGTHKYPMQQSSNADECYNLLALTKLFFFFYVHIYNRQWLILQQSTEKSLEMHKYQGSPMLL